MDAIVAGAAEAHCAQALVDIHRAGAGLIVMAVGVNALEVVLLDQPLGDELEVGLPCPPR